MVAAMMELEAKPKMQRERTDEDARPTMIRTDNLWKTYVMGDEEIHALRGVSFEIKQGEYVAIIGPSGSGKSTLMNMIGCLDTPSKGEYWLNGKLVSAWMTTNWPTFATKRSALCSRRSTCCRARRRCTTSSYR